MENEIMIRITVKSGCVQDVKVENIPEGYYWDYEIMDLDIDDYDEEEEDDYDEE